jgi:predicted metal-dependent HD superfamily phosphohydrolase
MLTLRQRWQETWQPLALQAPTDSLFDELVAHYQELHRHYHTLQHLHECFAMLDELRPDVEPVGEIALAIWFHDAIYDVRRQDNEQASAAWAGACLAKAAVPEATVRQVQRLIMATRHHQPAGDAHMQVLLDVDLSILGAEPARFAEYEQQIRAEYRHVPDAVFVARRRQVLAEFVRRPRIFNTSWCYERYEQRAQENLANALRKLR